MTMPPEVLDTSVVGGLPQARLRTYIVGWKIAEADPSMKWQWPARIPCRSVSSLLDCTDVSDLHHGVTTEKGKARVQQHLVSVAKMIQDSILKCSATKACVGSIIFLSLATGNWSAFSSSLIICSGSFLVRTLKELRFCICRY